MLFIFIKKNLVENIKEILKDKNPDLEKLIDLALSQERMMNEENNKKVFNLFKFFYFLFLAI